jgi:hypothetical protein
LNKGLVVSDITLAVKYERKAPFAEKVSNARRQGDKNKSHKLRGEMMKLLGNASYGKCITNFLKHEIVKIVREDQYDRYIRKSNYKSHQDSLDGYEFQFRKTSFKQSLPIQIGFAVYQLAKLRMLQFYYDFIQYYLDRSDFQYVIMDTDSAYIAITGICLEDVIKDELKEQFKREKHLWLGRDDSEENRIYDSRTPGLFKLEYEGDGIIALASKMYFCFGEKDKFSCKGINKKQNEITKQNYMNALNGESNQHFTNKGFRVKDNQMNTYSLQKFGMKLFNDKRLRVGYDTFPIEL